MAIVDVDDTEITAECPDEVDWDCRTASSSASPPDASGERCRVALQGGHGRGRRCLRAVSIRTGLMCER